MADLSWKLSNECDELTTMLRPIAKKLETLHVEFRKTKQRLSQGILDRCMQDIILNTCDGCYGILYNLSQEMQQSQQKATSDAWGSVVWGEEQLKCREEMLEAYGRGLAALNSGIGR